MVFVLADRLVLRLKGREFRFRLRRPLPPSRGEILALLPDGPGAVVWVRIDPGERVVLFLDFPRREARAL
ncbi:hypothetical protein [Thermoflexus hugenholtzii]